MDASRAPGADTAGSPPADATTECSLTDPGVQRLGSLSRAWRTVLVVVLGTLFIGGTAIGDDHWWPFAPWRMFSTSTAPSGAVVAMSIEHRVAGDPRWRPASLTPESVGLNRAEVEGRIPQLTENPAMLGTLARTHARLHPDEVPWTGVRVVRTATVLVDRAPTGEVQRSVIAQWEAQP